LKLTVIKRFEFEYAHYLPGYDGPCANLHGHRAELEVGVSGVVDAKTGMVIDFKTLKSVVKQVVVDLLDHSCLNDFDMKDFPSDCPTAENTLLWIVSVLRLALFPVELTVVRLWETSGSYCEWRA
jgi:6-pyruvoyltetrahydropterin/6-carboxytetrahydropterin synthase